MTIERGPVGGAGELTAQRELFEAWWIKRHPAYPGTTHLQRTNKAGAYDLNWVNGMWLAWQAALAAKAPQGVSGLRECDGLAEAAQWVIEWEQDYRTLNNLGRNPPMVFIHLAKELAALPAAPKPALPSCNASHVETEEGAGSATRHATSPSSAQEVNSRSQQKRVAALKGEPMPTFAGPAPGAERLREALDQLIIDMRFIGKLEKLKGDANFSKTCEWYAERAREALAAAPPASCPCGAITSTDIESLAATFHAIYQQEAKRQGDVRHKDAYADLPDNVKEFDRVLARYVLANFSDRHASAERVRQLEEALRNARHVIMQGMHVCLQWARQSREGGWSTHQVDSNNGWAQTFHNAASVIDRALPPSTGEKVSGATSPAKDGDAQ